MPRLPFDRPRLRAPLFAVVLAAALAPGAGAHGGMYRGPGPFPVIAPPGGPTTGGGLVPLGPAGPNTGFATGASPTSWQFWWEFNKAPYLRLRDAVRAAGAAREQNEITGDGISSLVPTDADKRERILPALKKLLDSTDSKDVATACMVAMAKIGVDHPDFEIQPIFRKHVARGNQEVRETAALCMGISRRVDALDDLLPIVLDDARGRRMVGRERVDDRTRTFAIYGLGLVARHNDSKVKRRVYEVLSELLADRDVTDRDVRVALIQSLGQLGLDPVVGAQKRLLWQAVETLWTDYQRDIGKGAQITQAHVPTSIARLLGRGTTPTHERSKARLVEELTGRRRRHDSIYQSAALALGRLALPAEVHPPDEQVHDALLRYAKKGKDELARYFCLIAMGEIGGEANRNELLKFYVRGGKATVRPWAAIALGLLAHESQRQSGTVDATIGRALINGFRNVENGEHRSATAVALGLCGDPAAVRDLVGKLDKYKRNDTVGGYLCIGLALLGERSALPEVRELVDKSVRRPLLLNFAAIALAKLGDKEAPDRLMELLRGGDSNLAKLSAIATAFGFIGDRRVIVRLADLMFADDMTTLSRAFVAAALGGIADPLALPWNTSLASGTNYRAEVSTLTNGSTGVLDIL